MNNNILAFDKLPADVQAKIIALQTPAEDRFVFIPRLSKVYWLAIVAAIGWCVYLFSATQDYLWENWMFGLFAAGSLVLITLALLAILKIILSKTAKLKNGFVFTPDECLKTSGKRVEFWNLTELEGFQFREDIKTIEIWIGERVEKIKAENIADAERLDKTFGELSKNSEESFLAPFAKPEFAFNSSMKYAAMAGAFVLFLAVSFGFAYAAKVMNRNFDDAQSWKRSENGTTVAEFEDYKQRHPNGNYAAEADRRISEINSKLKDEYQSKAKPTADPNAVKGLSELLENVGKLPNRTLYVKINEKRELDDAVVKKMKSVTGYPVSSYDYSVPANNEDFRKDRLSKDLGLVLLPATRNASLNFELTNDPPPNAAVLNVDYVVSSVENFYRYDWYSNGSITTFFNPAAKYNFDLSLKSFDGKELYKTNYVSLLTNPGNTGLIDSRDAANYTFDKVYFAGVSADLCKYLSRQFGFADL
jgi:hypothetical protein